MLAPLLLLSAVSALSCTAAEPELEPTLTLPIEAFLEALADPATVDGAFERYAFNSVDREGLGHLPEAKVTQFIGQPGYSCYTVEGQQDGVLAQYRICFVVSPVVRIADVDRLH